MHVFEWVFPAPKPEHIACRLDHLCPVYTNGHSPGRCMCKGKGAEPETPLFGCRGRSDAGRPLVEHGVFVAIFDGDDYAVWIDRERPLAGVDQSNVRRRSAE